MLLQQTSESEQRRRQQVTRDSRTALHLGITYEKAVERREEAARDWLRFLRTEMAALGANDPAEILHVLAYRIEMKSAETACAVAKIVAKQTVREMLSKPERHQRAPWGQGGGSKIRCDPSEGRGGAAE
jgi:hypothetical protein